LLRFVENLIKTWFLIYFLNIETISSYKQHKNINQYSKLLKLS
jgi:hypothetical protein